MRAGADNLFVFLFALYGAFHFGGDVVRFVRNRVER
jgi:hypothetical protein